MNIEFLYHGDKHADALYCALESTLQERGQGMSVPTLLGVIELLKDYVKENAK